MMRTLPKLACALALSASALTAGQSPAEAHYWRYWGATAPAYTYLAPTYPVYAYPYYDNSGAIAAGLMLGIAGAAIVAAASQPAYVYPAWPGCVAPWVCY